MAITDTSNIINPTVAHRFRSLQSLNLQGCIDTSCLHITTIECIQDISKTYLNLTLQVQNITLQEATDKFEYLNCCLIIVLFVWKIHFIFISQNCNYSKY